MAGQEQVDKARTALDADVAALTDSVIEAVRPVIERQIRQRLGEMANRQVKAMLMPLLQGTMTDQHIQASPAQDARKEATGFSGTSTAGVIEYMRTKAGEGGARGADILDFLETKGVTNRETARKAVSRAREMGLLCKDERGRWHATDKLKELPA